MPLSHPAAPAREGIGEPLNPLGMAGIEFIEYATRRPQALGQVLETMGFQPVARHRSREVLLYRQGDMNVVINAHGLGEGSDLGSGQAPVIAAIGLRVRDAAAAFARALQRGAWAVPARVAPMELNIPAIHGVGHSRLYLVDRCEAFSIWDVDFVPIPAVQARPSALAGLHWFGLVQYIGAGRMADWCEFYRELFGFDLRPDDERQGILPAGRILQSPCRSFYVQLIEPQADDDDHSGEEGWQRIGLGAPDVRVAVQALAARGAGFTDSPQLTGGERGALTQTWLGSVMFELVHDERPAIAAAAP